MLRGAVKNAYQIRERGFDTPANRHRIGFVGGLGAVYPHPSQERKHRASVPAVPSHERNALHNSLRPRSHTSTTNAAAIACDGRAVNTRNDKARHGQRVRRRSAAKVHPRPAADVWPAAGKKSLFTIKNYISMPARARPDLRTT